MKQPPRQRLRKDERELAIEKEARSYALEGMIRRNADSHVDLCDQT